MMRAFILFATLALSLACGGGASESSSSPSTSSTPISLKIEMVYPEDLSLSVPKAKGRGKFAVIDANTPFRIGSDLNDTLGDPIHATHARARFFRDGIVVAEGVSALVRYTTDPATLDPNSRKVSVSGVYGDNLNLTVQLGQDFGEIIAPRIENIFYTGSVNNIRITGSNVIVNGQMSDVVKVELKTNIDFAQGIYTLQGYLDYSTMPLVEIVSDVDERASGEFGQSSLTSFDPLESGAIGGYQRKNIAVSDNLFGKQALFFEMVSLPLSQIFFSVSAESGPSIYDASGNVTFWSKNMILGGLVTPSDALSGNSLLFDFETTFNKLMATWHEYPSLGRSSGNLLAVYEAMPEAFKRVDYMLSAANSGNAIDVFPEDLALLQLTYSLVQQLNTGDRLGTTVTARTFDSKIGQVINSGATNGLNHFFYTGNVTYQGNVLFSAKQVPLQVNLRARGFSDNLFITKAIESYTDYVTQSGNAILDMSGNTVPLSGSNIIQVTATDNVIGYRMSNLFSQNIVSPYFSANAMWDYIEKETFTDLKSILPIPTTAP